MNSEEEKTGKNKLRMFKIGLKTFVLKLIYRALNAWKDKQDEQEEKL